MSDRFDEMARMLRETHQKRCEEMSLRARYLGGVDDLANEANAKFDAECAASLRRVAAEENEACQEIAHWYVETEGDSTARVIEARIAARRKEIGK